MKHFELAIFEPSVFLVLMVRRSVLIRGIGGILLTNISSSTTWWRYSIATPPAFRTQ
jgi:hypothetical protein